MISIVSASFSQSMIINGEGYIRVDAEIRIIDLKMLSVSNHGFETYNSRFSKDITSMYVTLPEIGSTVTYQVTIQNKSSYVYIISGIRSELNNADITYSIDDYKIGQGLEPKATTTINITFKYNSKTLPTDHEQEANLYFTFSRPYANQVSYDNKTSQANCSDVQCALDDLYQIYKSLGG